MAVKTAEDCITNCGKCNKKFTKNEMILAAPKKDRKVEFWFLCSDCLDEEGGIWWVGKVPEITIKRY